ncbi:hypothetical protein [Streptomyces sp. AM6-12]|uniref:hypothetical protein n=1 Tax=Streptomyces sp. AM6-12 TaxID=3345149 RepID=UPI00378E0720
MSTDLAAPGVSRTDAEPQDSPVLVLRAPVLRLTTWYRIAEIARHRGTLPETKFRLAKFLNAQRLDRMTGRVEGRYGTEQLDGGIALSERYAYVYEVGTDRYWDDLKGLYRLGFAEQVQKPAPGRRAVYALCLRADAIPSDLPEDLMHELRVWDLPEPEDPYEDAAFGRMSARPAPAVEPVVVRGSNRETQELITTLAVTPRWEHPADSSAAAVAQAIRKEWVRAARAAQRAADSWPGWEPVGEPKATLALSLAKPIPAPDLRCIAVADRDRAAEMTARVHRLMLLGSNGKASPLYARGFSQLDGFSTDRSGELMSPSTDGMEKTKATPSAATRKRAGQAFGDDLSAVARKVVRRVWHSWRAQLGHGVVFLPSGTPEELSRSITGDAWNDLHHAVEIALRRATESELVELLTRNVIRRNEWGEITYQAENLGRLAGWRLWRLINSRKNAHGYGRRCEIRHAAHVEAWDNMTPADLARRRARAHTVGELPGLDLLEDLREQERRREAARLAAEAELAAQAKQAAEEARRRELTGRWSLDRYAAQSPTRRWSAREPEEVHEAQMEVRRALDAPRYRASSEVSWQSAVARARAEKRTRRRGSDEPPPWQR